MHIFIGEILFIDVKYNMMSGLKLDDGKYLLVGSFIDRDNPTNIAVVTDEDNIHKLTLQFESGNNIDFIYDEDVKKYGMGLTIIEKKNRYNIYCY